MNLCIKTFLDVEDLMLSQLFSIIVLNTHWEPNTEIIKMSNSQFLFLRWLESGRKEKLLNK